MNAPLPTVKPFPREMVSTLAHHYFPRKKIKVHELGGGLTNNVFSVNAGNEQVVIRISNDPCKIDYFLKEQWAVSQARSKNIPVTEIFEVGNTVIPLPYMISAKVEGMIGTGHPERKEILFQLGQLASIIHTIPTRGYGSHFGWSSNKLSIHKSWEEFLGKELDLRKRLDLLKRNKMITAASFRNILVVLKDMFQWKGRPILQHGDLRLKNVMVNKQGHIKALIDWEECISSIGPAWDLSIALHDLPVDGQQRFLEGYGMSVKKLIGLKDYLKTFNLLNYAPVIEQLKREKNNQAMAYYRARMHGAMDLFAI